MAGGESMAGSLAHIDSNIPIGDLMHIGRIQRLTRAHARSVSGTRDYSVVSEAEKKSSVGMYIWYIVDTHNTVI